ncbi:MAG: transporter substrate-binding domain-containing protein [Alcanivoracaceae bacterium]|nr:transporter substrate-binding domain-containing protein [Alcanivoracaceae bacterium]
MSVWTRALCLTLAMLLLSACSDSEKVSAVKPEEFRNYTETGDLDALERRGLVRLVAPRFDDDPALPRDGLPLDRYREIAEAFVRVLGLEPQWVVVDGYDELIPALEEGRADIIVTNLTRTEARSERVGFSVPVRIVDEVLVVPPALADVDVETVERLAIAVPPGTSYAETARDLAEANPGITIKQVPPNTADVELVDGVAAGEYQAAIVDSNLAEVLVRNASGAVLGPVVAGDREIAWATRTDNTELRRRLNEFLTATQVALSRQKRVLRSWTEIRESGVLRVITSNSPSSYFLWRGELMGFDYDLMRRFAEKHGLRVAVVVRNEPEDMKAALEQGVGDVIAASLTRTPRRESAGWNFSSRYLLVTEKVLARHPAKPLASVEDLAGKTVAVNPQHSFLETLEALQARGIDVRIKPMPGTTTEMLVQGLADGEHDYVMADSHLAALELTLRDDIQEVLDMGEQKKIAWVVRDDQPALTNALNSFIRKAYRGLHYNILYKRYFSEPKTIARYKEFRVEPGKPVSPYDELVRELSFDTDFDWRLLVSQMYQESRFDPDARSFAGALGLMQVLPRTARQFDIDGDLHDPRTNIRAGLAFQEWLEHRFPARLPLEERLYFTLAAYNAGHGHVHDARRLARQLGKNPDKWFGEVEQAMLLLSQPEYARKARYGYVRGTEPVKYVREIRERYLGYLQVTGATTQ